MKKLKAVCAIGILLLMTGCATTSTKPGTRVENVDVGNMLSQYYDDSIEVVAFAPGSGWVKINTRDGISPMLHLGNVSVEDIQKFNRFSQSIGLPIRTELAGNVLYLALEESEKNSILAKERSKGRKTDMRADAGSKKQKVLQPEQAPRLIIRKDQDGRVFLVSEEGRLEAANKEGSNETPPIVAHDNQ